jgi:hypothetical protein
LVHVKKYREVGLKSFKRKQILDNFDEQMALESSLMQGRAQYM